MQYFVNENSIVRQIWGKADTVLFIFAGAAAEFALNKAVDWLYFTGRLPADPLGRLFSTVEYSRQIIFAPHQVAVKAIQNINAIHRGVENARGSQIPDWAYRDVLFMLIDYSIRSFEALERPLTSAEREEVFEVFNRVGKGMNLANLPQNYTQWQNARLQHLQQDMVASHFTVNLYAQYRKHLGWGRYWVLKQVQILICPPQVKNMLKLSKKSVLKPVLWLYKLSRLIKLDRPLKQLLLPANYKGQIMAIDQSF